MPNNPRAGHAACVSIAKLAAASVGQERYEARVAAGSARLRYPRAIPTQARREDAQNRWHREHRGDLRRASSRGPAARAKSTRRTRRGCAKYAEVEDRRALCRPDRVFCRSANARGFSFLRRADRTHSRCGVAGHVEVRHAGLAQRIDHRRS
jgi:hypothetical protein